MIHEIRVPAAGESVTEVFIGKWRKNTGDFVKKGEVLVDLESQKATFELESEFSGRIEILYPNTGDKVAVGEVLARVDDSAKAATGDSAASSPAKPAAETSTKDAAISPSVRKILTENNINPATITGTGKDGRITREDVLSAAKASSVQTQTTKQPAQQAKPQTSAAPTATPQMQFPSESGRPQRRVAASRIRQQIAKNLLAAQHTAAILTTFNEVDMTQILEFRKKNKEDFQAKHGVAPGMVGFFAMAAARALQAFPLVNAYFTGEEIIYNDYIDLSIAVSTERGLVVPVIRDLQKLDLVGFEKALAALSDKARTGKLSIPDMTGGTFTISNGGLSSAFTLKYDRKPKTNKSAAKETIKNIFL
jgi:2-oxoglutarate dehydrogenase E2 component (dihydrolipoamide succinyltransferase)